MLKTLSNAIAVISESLQESLSNKATFPEHVKMIASVGVTRYEVDLLSHKIKYQFSDGNTHTENLPSPNNQINSPIFSKSEVKAAISDAQQKMIDYPIFLNRIVAAGTKSYEVDIAENKVTYKGEKDSLVEKFPQFSKDN